MSLKANNYLKKKNSLTILHPSFLIMIYRKDTFIEIHYNRTKKGIKMNAQHERQQTNEQ